MYIAQQDDSTGNGEYDAPYKTIMKAIDGADVGDKILLQTDFVLTENTRLIIEKEVWLETADIDNNGEEITERLSIKRDSGFYVRDKTSPTATAHLITVEKTGVLTLRNIVIDGQQTYAGGTIRGSNLIVRGDSTKDYAEGGTLIIEEDTWLTGDHSFFPDPLLPSGQWSGGGGVFMLNGTLEMRGGEISGNSQNHENGMTSGVGTAYVNNVKYILTGGIITGNISDDGRAILFSNDTIVGGEFTVKDNWGNTAKTKQANVDTQYGTGSIAGDFNGELYIKDASPERNKQVSLIYLGEDDFPIETVIPESDPNLHLRMEGDTVVWDYFYTEYEEYRKPTYVEKGEIRQYAIIDEVPREEVFNNLPVIVFYLFLFRL